MDKFIGKVLIHPIQYKTKGRILETMVQRQHGNHKKLH